MLKKLLSGEFPLKDTFWKFGVLVMVLLNSLIVVFGGLLFPNLKGYSIYNYFTKYMTATNTPTSMIVLTICYVTTLFVLFSYSAIITVAIFKSSAEYDRSLWLRHISRILIIAMVYFSLKRFF